MDETLKKSIHDLMEYADGNDANVDVDRESVPVWPNFTPKLIKAMQTRLAAYTNQPDIHATLATILGVTKDEVARWESNETLPKASTKRLLQILLIHPELSRLFI